MERYSRLKCGQAFHLWLNRARALRQPESLKEMSGMEKKKKVFRALQICASRRARVKHKAVRNVKLVRKLMVKILFRWHQLSAINALKRQVVYARLLPFKKKAFLAWRAHSLPDYVDLKPARKLSIPIGRRASLELLQQSIGGGQLHGKGLPQLTAFRRNSKSFPRESPRSLRRTSRVELSCRPILPAHMVQAGKMMIPASEVFSAYNVRVFTDETRLLIIDELEAEDRQQRLERAASKYHPPVVEVSILPPLAAAGQAGKTTPT